MSSGDETSGSTSPPSGPSGPASSSTATRSATIPPPRRGIFRAGPRARGAAVEEVGVEITAGSEVATGDSGSNSDQYFNSD